MRWTTLFVCIAGLIAAQTAGAQSSREGTWETRLGIAFQNSADMDFEGGTTADFDSDTGLRLGFGYHYTDHLEFGMNFGWGQTDYDAKIAGDEVGEIFGVNGEFEYFTFAGDVTYNFLTGPFSPFVVGAIGWSWIDTNIATGPPQTGCWWDPWWGYVCTTFYDTYSDTRTGYTYSVGVRWDVSDAIALRAAYGKLDMDTSHATKDVNLDTWRAEIVWKF